MSLRMVRLMPLTLCHVCGAGSTGTHARVGSSKGLFLARTSIKRNPKSEKIVREEKSVSGAAQPPRRTNYEETDKL